MVVAPAILFIYATAIAEGVPGLRFASVATTAPVSGFNRRFCPADVTKRIRSTVGLKSKPTNAPVIAGVNGPAPTAVALPVSWLTIYIRLVLPNPYNWPVAGLKSMASKFSPVCKPVMAMVDIAVSELALYFTNWLEDVRA